MLEGLIKFLLRHVLNQRFDIELWCGLGFILDHVGVVVGFLSFIVGGCDSLRKGFLLYKYHLLVMRSVSR